jgi:hypothetical protein
MKTIGVVALAGLALAADCLAVETKYWQQSDQSDFEKGTLTQISLRSDGRLFLAPSLTEMFDTATPYLWSVARDSKGYLYTGGGGTGGGTARLFEIAPDGKTRKLVELNGLEIHAVAVNRNDEIFAATAPDGQVWRVSRDGKAQPFFDPKAKYIWALAFDSKGNLYVATGDKGEIFRVAPDGKGAVFFATEETHARALAIDSNDNVIVGSDPSGLVIRVSPQGKGFVLYQTSRREITSVAIAPNGAIYVAGSGIRTAAPPSSPAVTTLPVAMQRAEPAGAAPGTPPAPGPTQTIQVQPIPSTPAYTPSVSLASGGSEVYRIDPDGTPRRVWNNSHALVYAIAFDGEGHALLGTGNSGRVYRLDSDVLSTILLDLPPTQVTGFTAGPEGALYAVTGNIGKVYRIGPGLAKSGTYQSDVLDGGEFSRWGRFSIQADNPRGRITAFTRSGNLNRTQNNWSDWAAVKLARDPQCGNCQSGAVTSPPARFMQYKLALESTAGSPVSPEGRTLPAVAVVTMAYLPRNVAPQIEALEVTPANYRFPAPSASGTSPSAGSPSSVTLPPLGAPRPPSSGLSYEPSLPSTLTYSKGWIGARWASRDENGDTMLYTIEIRGVNDKQWIPLRDKVREKYVSWDSTAFPDGEYELRVTASDEPTNPPAQALTARMTSDAFVIDNTPPQISGLAAGVAGTKIEIRWGAEDPRSTISKAEYSVNGGEWMMAAPVGGLSDSSEENYDLAIPRSAGEQVIAVRVTDDFDNQTVAKTIVR